MLLAATQVHVRLYIIEGGGASFDAVKAKMRPQKRCAVVKNEQLYMNRKAGWCLQFLSMNL